MRPDRRGTRARRRPRRAADMSERSDAGAADRGAPLSSLAEDGPAPRWNLLDPLVGFIAAQVLSALVAAVVIDAQAGRGAGVGLGLASAFDGGRRTLMTGLGLAALAL